MLIKNFLARVGLRVCLVGCMGYVRRRGTTTAKVDPETFNNLRKSFLEEIQSVVEFEDVLLDLG